MDYRGHDMSDKESDMTERLSLSLSEEKRAGGGAVGWYLPEPQKSQGTF